MIYCVYTAFLFMLYSCIYLNDILCLHSILISICCTAIYTKVMSSKTVHGEVYSIQHCVIKFISDLLQVDGFLRVLRFHSPLKLTVMILILKYCLVWR